MLLIRRRWLCLCQRRPRATSQLHLCLRTGMTQGTHNQMGNEFSCSSRAWDVEIPCLCRIPPNVSAAPPVSSEQNGSLCPNLTFLFSTFNFTSIFFDFHTELIHFSRFTRKFQQIHLELGAGKHIFFPEAFFTFSRVFFFHFFSDFFYFLFFDQKWITFWIFSVTLSALEFSRIFQFSRSENWIFLFFTIIRKDKK